MFVALAEEGVSKRAARRVRRTQPGLRMAMKRLENQAGAPLFRREERGQYLLTVAGATLYCYALRLLRLIQEAQTAMQRFHEIRHLKRAE